MNSCINYVFTEVEDKNINTNNKTVLFLHGWGGNLNSFFPVQKSFIKKYNTLNLDFPGFGKSKEPNIPFDTYMYALSVYEILKKLNISEIIIIAHSFGGRIAILLSSIFHIKVTNLILISSAGIKPRRSLWYYFKVYTYKLFKFLVKKNIISHKFLKFFGSKDYKQLSKTMKQTFVNVVNQDLKMYLRLISAKCLIVWGKKDDTTPLYFAKILHREINRSKLLVYKKSGHFCYLENKIDFCIQAEKFINS